MQCTTAQTANSGLESFRGLHSYCYSRVHFVGVLCTPQCSQARIVFPAVQQHSDLLYTGMCAYMLFTEHSCVSACFGDVDFHASTCLPDGRRFRSECANSARRVLRPRPRCPMAPHCVTLHTHRPSICLHRLGLSCFPAAPVVDRFWSGSEAEVTAMSRVRGRFLYDLLCSAVAECCTTRQNVVSCAARRGLSSSATRPATLLRSTGAPFTRQA